MTAVALTAEDWAFTADVALKLELQGNWATYDPAYLDHIEAVDDYTAKVYYHTKPGLAIHQFGVLLNPIVSKAFWEPMVAPLLERFATESDGLDAESDEYVTLQTEIVQELETLDPTGEPVAGAWIFSQWEEGAYVENVRNPEYFNYMTTVTEYTSGGYKEVRVTVNSALVKPRATFSLNTPKVPGLIRCCSPSTAPMPQCWPWMPVRWTSSSRPTASAAGRRNSWRQSQY